ncbi:hypothetical protein AVEN_251247-1 [Araneus ventricosus]|uniref:Uncharacterized protein n=1 Tax=Araneus ventricosus TaxID=182803 RepID=A0A4Y2SBX6_ARAVE|nr:hypothetical protein AVEN_132045-1 [Araneus ventricosus]GBN84793.1 hypothetical protein AVEN_49787-1 [Araneus ventricosus]GBN84809.1 hypothetical protein AVEN_251247-1 [Araneus ventricosus]
MAETEKRRGPAAVLFNKRKHSDGQITHEPADFMEYLRFLILLKSQTARNSCLNIAVRCHDAAAFIDTKRHFYGNCTPSTTSSLPFLFLKHISMNLGSILQNIIANEKILNLDP